MIDFKNATLAKLRPVSDESFGKMVNPLLTNDENIVATFRGLRDGVVITDKRLIIIDVQGVVGKMRDFSSLPYRNIQAFTVRTAGVFDIDSELDLWFSGLGNVILEFSGKVDISAVCRVISAYIL